MRAAASLLCLLLVSATWPGGAAAQVAKSVAAGTAGSAAVPVLSPVLSPAALTAPSLPAPSLSPSMTPAPPAPVPLAASAVAVAGQVPGALKAAAPVKIAAVRPATPIAARVAAAAKISGALERVPVSAAPAASAEIFSLLTEEPLALRGAGDAVLAAAADSEPPSLPPSGPAKTPADPAVAKSVRRMMIGTAAMKSGMETVTLSVPLLALSALGGATMVAALVVAYGVSQAAFAGAAGGLADRYSARKVLAGAVVTQAALVATVIGLGALHLLSAGTLLPLYVLIGGAVGIAETTRHSIPALLLGQDGEALSRYNARLHIAYETAGVAGALAAGALIGLAGPLWSLLIQPPAYLLAAWFFLRVRHDRPAGVDAAALAAKGRVWSKIKEYFLDVKAGAKIVLGNGRLRWIALAFVLPQIVHRVFENLLIPVFAKTILHAPQSSAWLLTASNLGELLGAMLLLKFASRFKGPSAWVKYGALGLLLIWTLAFSTALPVLLPLILASSLTWAASDLSLRSEVQGTVAEKEQPRALAFLYGVFVLGSAAASFALGGFIDWLGMGAALYWICGVIVAISASVLYASRRVKR